MVDKGSIKPGHWLWSVLTEHRRNFRETGIRTPTFLEWDPPLYKYTKSEIVLGPLTFQTKVTPLWLRSVLAVVTVSFS